LPQQTNQRVAAVLARACIGERLARHHAQPKSVVEFAVDQQPGIRNGAAKLQRQAAVEIEPDSVRRQSSPASLPPSKPGSST